MSTTLTESARELLTLLERESEAWPGQARIELDERDAFVVTSYCVNAPAAVGPFYSYRLIGTNGWQEKWTREGALRCLEAFIKREQEAALAEVGQLIGVI